MGKTGEDLSLVIAQPGLELADTVVSRACSPPGDQVLGGSEEVAVPLCQHLGSHLISLPGAVPGGLSDVGASVFE